MKQTVSITWLLNHKHKFVTEDIKAKIFPREKRLLRTEKNKIKPG